MQQLDFFADEIVNALTSHIAILNRKGEIIAVNKAYRDFAAANPPVDTNLFEGANYLAVCDAVQGKDAEEAYAFAAGVRRVLDGDIPAFSMEYDCHSPEEKRWFIAQVSRFMTGGECYAVISHENITQRKLAELALNSRMVQQACIADVGYRAISTHDIQTLIEDTVEQLRIVLDIECCEVFEFIPQRDQFFLRAAAGSEEIIKYKFVEAGAETQLGFTFLNGEAVIINDYQTDKSFQPPVSPFQENCLSRVSVLISGIEKPFGVLLIGSVRRSVFTPDNVVFLQGIANILAAAIQRKKIEAEIEQRNKELTLLLDLSQRLAGEFEVNSLLNLIIETVVDIMPHAESASLWLYDSQQNSLLPKAWAGMDIDLTGLEIEPDSAELVALVYRTSETQKINITGDGEKWKHVSPIGSKGSICSIIGAPLVIEGLPIGCLFAHNVSRLNAFDDDSSERMIEALAAHMATAIRSAQMFMQLHDSQVRLQLLSQKVISAQEEERQRVSRELHDEAGQAMTALVLMLEAMRADLTEPSLFLAPRLDEAITLTDSTMEQMRLLAQDLRPPALDALGLNATLRGYCFDFSRRANILIDYQGIDLPVLASMVEISLYRFLQEAFTNIARHSNATHVVVSLEETKDSIVLSVTDNGRGFEPASRESEPTGMGLLGMQERLKLLGGWILINSKIDEGTRLIANVPKEIHHD